MLGVLARNPQFRKLWLAQVVSQSGDWLNRIACLVLIGRLGGTAQIGALFGLELGLRLLPSALLGPLAGPIADRLPRRLLMVASDLARALIVLGFLFVRDSDDLGLLYALIVAQMGIGIFFDSARSAALPDTVARGDLQTAHALSAATWSAVLGIGSYLGGVLVARIGLDLVFALDAATYVASALFLHGMKLPPVPVHAQRFHWRDVVFLTDLRRGLAHARELGIAPILAAKTFWGAAGGFLVLLPIVAHERFGDALEGTAAAVGTAAGATGALYAARGVGTGFGPLLARALAGSSDRSLKLQISTGFLVAACGYVLFGKAAGLSLACLWVAIAHLGGSMLWVASTVYWQKHVEDAFRGRVFALEFLGMNLAFAAGGLLAGAVYDRTRSLDTTVWTISLLVLVLGLAWTVLARGVRSRDRAPGAPAGSEEAGA